MIHEPTQIRRGLAGAFQAFAHRIFAGHPEIRSVMLCVSQHWNDNASDEVHAHPLASERELPLWPHRCARRYYYDDAPWIAGEHCDYCTADADVVVPRFELRGGDPEMIAAIEPYCEEQDDEEQAAYAYTQVPFAIVRRDRPVELIGRLVRSEQALIDRSEVVAAPPLDPRALQLLDEVATDDGARRVLADHLLERGDPRGQYMALALAGLDEEAAALLDEHLWEWIDPLGAVVPAGCARFARGLLSAVDVWATDDASVAAVRGAPAWRTVETLRFLPGSRTDVLDAEMRALRDVGPVDEAGLIRLAKLGLGVQLERLSVRAPGGVGIVMLDALDPQRLRELAIAMPRDRLWHLERRPWWPQLERVALAVEGPAALRLDPPPLADGMPRWLGISGQSAAGEPIGWQLGYRRDGLVEITLVDWHEEATLTQLGQIIGALPAAYQQFELVPSRCYAPDRAEAQFLARLTERSITVG